MNRNVNVRVRTKHTGRILADYKVSALTDVPSVGDALGVCQLGHDSVMEGHVISRNLFYMALQDGQLRLTTVSLTVEYPVDKWIPEWECIVGPYKVKDREKGCRKSNKYLCLMADKASVRFLLDNYIAYGIDSYGVYLLTQFLTTETAYRDERGQK